MKGLTDERLGIWLGFVRFLLGTFALGLVGTLINGQIQQRDIELKEQEQVGSFLEHALQEDVGVRRRFAQYFSTVTRSTQLRKRWQSYYEVVQAEYDSIEKEKNELEKVVKQKDVDENERERLFARIAEYEQALSARPASSFQTDWFTILASFKEYELDRANAHADSIAKELSKLGIFHPIQIYKTRISRHYAVIVGGRLSKAAAIKLARIAREKNWAEDAFAQVDKNWILVKAVNDK